jgi:hypothetical protein
VSAVRFSVHGEQTFWYRCELRVFVSPSRVRGSQTSFSTRSVPFRPPFRGVFVSLGVFSTLSQPASTLLPSVFSPLSVVFDTLGTPSDPPADGFDPLRPPNRISTLSFARDTLSDPTPVSALDFCGSFYDSNTAFYISGLIRLFPCLTPARVFYTHAPRL